MSLQSALLTKPYNSTHYLVSWVFLRGLAIIYFAAFASMAVQIEGLVGKNGILPIQSKLTEIALLFPSSKYIEFPTVFWLDASDQALVSVCFAGMAAAVLLLVNVFARMALILCYILYLSITVAGQDFTAFQWDVFLLEAGFLGIFLTWGSELIVFLYRWLIARFMFMGGVVKLASGDPSWSNLTALNYHYQTQPLPSPLAYYAYYLPHWFNAFCVAAVLIIELIVPFFVFLPRRFRLFAAWSFIALQSSIMLGGSYNFFNVLTILLCLFLFDDEDIEKRLPTRLILAIRQKQPIPGPVANAVANIWVGLVLLICATHIWIYHAKRIPIAPLNDLVHATSAFSLINNYGPFAIMTTERPEIIVEGSNDGTNWKTYQFKYKPVKLDQPLKWNIPHQPRLDWQMWFAAMEKPAADSWFAQFMGKLQEGSPQVLSLLAANPFPDKPPVYVRALLYRYSYSPREQRATTGRIWQREYLGVYWPPQQH
ncbi:MAG: lipase maturation factor family protein [Planctomycetes bacterium]|nr:lipase maturation factor family protein [Planctomycetota bacterium]